MKKCLSISLFILALSLSAALATAGDFYVVPVKPQFKSWDTKIEDTSRFKLVLDDEAVLDRETGLVWEKSPLSVSMSWANTVYSCYGNLDGGRSGWRLPTIEELSSLIDYTQSNPALPSNHPFENIFQDYYWSITSSPYDVSSALVIDLSTGVYTHAPKTNELIHRWCVRGGYGLDPIAP